MTAAKKAGRGKFSHHKDYLAYKEFIVEHPNYREMPGARSPEGSINWQVSSGKTTSFYRFFEERQKWWIKKADELGLTGRGRAGDRLTTTARRIHPSGLRPCLICGKEKNVGYYYLNDRLEKQLNKMIGRHAFSKGQSIEDAIRVLIATIGREGTERALRKLFPERKAFFDRLGISTAAFRESNYVRSVWLSPGFMGDPPHRLDGLHDYCLTCRPQQDPGRSAENLRSYVHDRRAFEWWAEGDWNVADALYRSAGP